MDETYTFEATIAERWGSGELQIVPEDWQSFVEFVERSGIVTDIHWHPNNYVTVSAKDLVSSIDSNVRRVRYTIRPNPTVKGIGIRGVAIEPID